MKRMSRALPDEAPHLELDAYLPYLVNVLASRLSGELAAVYGRRFGITIPEWRVIAHLARHRDVSVREIHAKVGMDKSKVSRAAATLEAAGLVESRPGATDRRLVALKLTRKGRKLYAEVEPLALAFERDALAVLTAEEEAALRAAVDKLLAASPHRAPGEPAEPDDGLPGAKGCP